MILVWILSILMSILLLFIFALLLSKVVVQINSMNQTYSLRHGVFYSVHFFREDENPFLIRVRILFISFNLDLFKLMQKRGGRKSESKPKKRKKRKTKRKVSWSLFSSLLKEFKLNYFHLSIDPNDPFIAPYLILFAQLFNTWTPSKYSFHVNYINEFDLKAKLEIRPISLIKAYINNRNKP